MKTIVENQIFVLTFKFDKSILLHSRILEVSITQNWIF